jgi:hypothetical protein
MGAVKGASVEQVPEGSLQIRCVEVVLQAVQRVDEFHWGKGEPAEAQGLYSR